MLQTMADARRYENENEILSALHFIEDVSAKYQSISRNAEELHKMKEIAFSVLHGEEDVCGYGTGCYAFCGKWLVI